MNFKNPLALGFPLLVFAASLSAANPSFSSIIPTHIVGTGANQSGLIIDFNDGAATERYAFQYNWDGASGTISGAEMLLDVVASIAELSAVNSGTIADGFFLTELSFSAQAETNGDFVSNFDYWGYFTAGGTENNSPVFGGGEVAPDVLSAASVGAAELSFGLPGRFIGDHSWDVWSFGPYTSSYVVPEPSSYAFLAGIFAFALIAMRRRA